MHPENTHLRSLSARIALTLLCAMWFTVSSAQLPPNFTSTTRFGIQVPVYVWDQKTTAYDFAFKALEGNNEQGILILLGRDTKRMWYIQAGYSNDASEESFFMNLAYTDINDSTRIFPEKKMDSDSTYAMRFHTAFSRLFKSNKIENLNPVEAWSPPYGDEFIARVNSRELGHCFEWNFLVDDEDNGSCVFFFEWSTSLFPLQTSRDVIFFGVSFNVPADWKYFRNDETGEGYIANGSDTMFCRKDPPARVWFVEMMYYTPSGPNDTTGIRLNARTKAYNDSLHLADPTMLSHDRYADRFDGVYIQKWIPKGAVTSWIRWEYMGDTHFEMETTLLAPEKQDQWKKIVESWKEK